MNKICRDCQKSLPLHTHFYTESKSKDGYKFRCKDCEILRRNRIKISKLTPAEKGDYIESRYWEDINSINKLSLIFQCDEIYIIEHLKKAGIYLKEYKPCGNCSELKLISEFSTGQLNLNGWCKSCVLGYNDSYYKENSEKIKENTLEYYYENYENCIEMRRAYYYENKDNLLIKNKQYYQDHIEERTEYNGQYYLNNSDIIKENVQQWVNDNRALANSYKSKYRAKKINATPKWANLDKIKEFYNEAQRLTEETGVLHHVDHIIPLQGKLVSGFHIESNLQILTQTENQQKSNSFEPIIQSQL